MVKAVFVDYTGTLIEDGGPDVRKMVRRCCENSSIGGPEEMFAYWWKLVKEYEETYFGDNYMTEDEIVEEILGTLEQTIHLRENRQELHELCRRFWTYSPAFPDTGEFFARCLKPVYVITNNGVSYVEKGLADKGIRPAGIISADMARAFKPHRQLFDKALEISGCRREEVVHIGDSVTSDVKGAMAAGIRPILLNRKGAPVPEGVTAAADLLQALDLIAQM